MLTLFLSSCVTSDNLLILSDTPYLHVHNGDISIKLQEEGIDEVAEIAIQAAKTEILCQSISLAV